MMDGTMAAAVRLPCGAGGGDGTMLQERLTSPLDDDQCLDVDDGTLLDVLAQVRHAYRRLLQSNNGFYSSHDSEFLRRLHQYEVSADYSVISKSTSSDTRLTTVVSSSSGSDVTLTSSVTSPHSVTFPSPPAISDMPENALFQAHVETTAATNRITFAHCRLVSVPPCLRPIEEEDTTIDSDAESTASSSSSSGCDDMLSSDDELSNINITTGDTGTVDEAARITRHFSDISLSHVSSHDGNDAERCLQSDVRLDIDATCTLPSPRRDVYKRQRHSGVQQTAYCHAHSDITSLKTDDVNAAAQTATTSGLSTVLGLLDHVPLFYIALTSGASFAACVSSVYPSSVVAVVAMTSFVSFAFSSARRYVISHQLALR